MRCKAKSKSTGEQCKNHVVQGREVCRYHGGKTPRGVDSPHYKHGRTSRYAKVLPEQLKAKFEALLDEGESLSGLDDNITLIELRLVQLAEKLGQEDYGASWASMRKAYNNLMFEMRSGDMVKAGEELTALGALIDRGVAEYQTWQQILQVSEEKRRMAETKQRMLLKGETSLSVAEVMLLVSRMLDVFNTLVTDKHTKQALADELQKIIQFPKVS